MTCLDNEAIVTRCSEAQGELKEMLIILLNPCEGGQCAGFAWVEVEEKLKGIGNTVAIDGYQ